VFIVGSTPYESQAKRLSIFFATIRSRDDIMKAAIQNDLHASINFGSGNYSCFNFLGNAGMNT
jgi:hypothetical protein